MITTENYFVVKVNSSEKEQKHSRLSCNMILLCCVVRMSALLYAVKRINVVFYLSAKQKNPWLGFKEALRK